jgi:hypothetical protein
MSASVLMMMYDGWMSLPNGASTVARKVKVDR